MKKIKNFILPVAVILIGAGGALATNSVESSETLLEKGYRYDPTASVKCIMTNVNCSTIPNPVCTWVDGNDKSHLLFRYKNSTECGIQLYQP